MMEENLPLHPCSHPLHINITYNCGHNYIRTVSITFTCPNSFVWLS